MTLLPDAPIVHGPFVLRFSRHLSRLFLMGRHCARSVSGPLLSAASEEGLFGCPEVPADVSHLGIPPIVVFGQLLIPKLHEGTPAKAALEGAVPKLAPFGHEPEDRQPAGRRRFRLALCQLHLWCFLSLRPRQFYPPRTIFRQ